MTRLIYPVVLRKGTDGKLRVLGVGWNPVQDTVVFEVTLSFSKKRKGVYTGPSLDKVDLPQALPLVLIRRIVLGQVMMIFAPLGFVCSHIFLGKIYLRETWSHLPISCLPNCVPNGFASWAPCLNFSTTFWTAAYSHRIRSDNPRLQVIPIFPQG